MSEFEVKKKYNNVLKNWESEKVVSLQCLRVLQCTCSYVTALYKGSSWFMKSTPEALPGIMSWPLEFYCNNKDTDKMQILAMAKIHHQATLFILLVMGFFCAMDCYVCAGALSWKVNIDWGMILARWTFLAIIYRCIVHVPGIMVIVSNHS